MSQIYDDNEDEKSVNDLENYIELERLRRRDAAILDALNAERELDECAACAI